jgi:gluconolactonase
MIFRDGLRAPETPVVLDDGSWLVVEMAEGDGGVVRVAADASTATEVVKTGRPNGVAIDAEDNLWICEGFGLGDAPVGSICRANLDGSGLEVVIDNYQGKVFELPNDLVFGPDGALYFTDSGATIADFHANAADASQIEFDGRVYRYDPATGELDLLDSGLWFANGIAWGLEDDVFYVAETMPGTISRYRIGPGGEVVGKELVGDVIDRETEFEGIAGPDGFALAADGDIYSTVFGQGIVTVMGPDGAVRDRIETEDVMPTNLAFGPGDGKLYVTGMTKGSIEVFDVGVDGAPVHRGKKGTVAA